MSFSKQIAFITGAGAGIGRATAVAFARQGAKVAVSDVNETTGQETAEQIKEAGGNAFFIRCDVADPAQLETALNKTVEVFGRVDIAVNNAGIGGKFGKLLDQSKHDFDQMMAINVGSIFYGMQYQIRQMLAQENPGGRIVNVSSIAGVKGMPMGGPYSAAKHAVVGLTKTAAL